MKKKTIAIIIISLLAVFTIGCIIRFATSHNETKPSIDNSLSDNLEKNKTDDSNNEKLFSYSSGMEITNFTDNYVYDGSPIELSVEILNDGDEFEETFLLFVNGIQNEYYTDKDSNKQLYHTFKVPKSETVETTIYFEPQNCSVGDSVFVSFERMMNMNYMLPDTSYVNFYPNHEINGIFPFPIEIKSECEFKDNISCSDITNWQKSELSDEIIEDNIVYDDKGKATGESYLDNSSFISLYQNEPLDSYFVATDNGIELKLNAYGKSGIYRLGVYVDHILQPAFEGNYYSDVEIDRNHMMSRNVKIDLSGFSGLHCIYVIAVPIEDNSLMTIKTKSKLLQITTEKNDSNDDSQAANDEKEDNRYTDNNTVEQVDELNHVSKIINIGDGLLLVESDNKNYVYDTVNKTYSKSNTVISYGTKIQPIKNGFAVIGINGEFIELYDTDCNLTKTINPPKYDCGVYSVSDDGQRIIYSFSDENAKTYIYSNNMDLTDEKLITEFTMTNELNTIQGLNDILSYKDGVISFSGNVLINNLPQDFAICMGTINEKSKETDHYIIKKGNYLSSSIFPQINYFVELEDYHTDKSSSSIVSYSQFSEINVKTVALSSPNESHMAVISDNGLYLATYDEESQKIRAYDTSSNSLIYEGTVSVDDFYLAVDNNKNIYFIENGKISIIHFQEEQ